MQEWLAHWGAIHALGFSPDGLQLASVARNSGESLVVWDLRNSVRKAAVLASIDAERRMEIAASTVAWSPDGAWITSVCEDGTLRVWDASTFRQHSQLSGDDLKTSNFTSLRLFQWSPDSRYLAWIGRSDNSDYLQWTVWRTLGEEPPKVLRAPVCSTHAAGFHITAARLSLDPHFRCIAVAVYRRRDNEPSHRASNVFHVDRRLGGDHGWYIEIWDVISGIALATFKSGHARRADRISFSPDGRSLLSASDDGLFKIWDAESWQETASLKVDEVGGTPEACFSPDGKYVAATSKNHATNSFAVQLWRVGEASCAAVFTEHRHRVQKLAFSPNGESLASGDYEGLVHIRRLPEFI